MNTVSDRLKYMLFALCVVVMSFCACNQKDEIANNNIKYEQIPTSVYENRNIKETLTVVAYRQLKELIDGEYIRGTWEQVENSKPPAGILWKYPQGVTLYGLLYANEKVLHDPKTLEYVTQHNEIAARQFEYLNWQIMTYGRYTNHASMVDLI